MRILAIDPGNSCGFALFQHGELIEHGIYRLASPKTLTRFGDLGRFFAGLGPFDAVAIEQVGSVKQFKSYKSAAMNCGVQAVCADACGITGARWMPVQVNTWKKALGYGKRDTKTHKHYVEAVNEAFGLSLEQHEHDIAAAIGVGSWAVKVLEKEEAERAGYL